MTQQEFTDQLQKAFASQQAPVPSLRNIRSSKRLLLQRIEQLEDERFEATMISHLRKKYRGFHDVQRAQVKQIVLQYAREHDSPSLLSQLSFQLMLFSRKALATSFALVLIFTTFLGPFQTLQPLRMVAVAQAASLYCQGKVYVNGELCRNESQMNVVAGDQIRTDSNSLATVFYSDYTVLRLNDSSQVALDAKDRSNLRLVEGNIWLHSPGDLHLGTFKVDTGVLRAKVPQGAAGISTRGTLTQLYTTNAAVEVQIAKAEGSTELMTVAPEKQLVIQKLPALARVKESPLGSRAPDWVKANQLKDLEYLEIVKQKTLENTMADAGQLPGNIQDSLRKITQSARTILTWDQQARLHRQLTELDELFSESLVLLQKEDITTADSTFKAYQQKFTSLVASSSGTIRGEISAAETDSFGKLLRYHYLLLSPYSPEDPQYLLKQDLEQFAFDLTVRFGYEFSQSIVREATTNKLMLAHQFLSRNQESIAQDLLLETSDYVSKVLPLVPSALSSSDLAILHAMSQKSSTLALMAKGLKRLKIDQLQALIPQNQVEQSISGHVSGTAYKPLDSDADLSLGLVKVIGEAVQEPSPL